MSVNNSLRNRQRVDPVFAFWRRIAFLAISFSAVAFVMPDTAVHAQEVLQQRSGAATGTNRDDAAGQDLYERSRVGTLDDGRIVVPTNQVLSPAGRQVIVGGRPTDVALSPNGRWLAVLNLSQVLLVDVESGEIVSRAPNRGSFKGIVFTPEWQAPLRLEHPRPHRRVRRLRRRAILIAEGPDSSCRPNRGGRGGGACRSEWRSIPTAIRCSSR